jgi:hypothetical protein
MPKTKLSQLIDEEDVKVIEKEEVEIPKKKVFRQTDGVICRSVVSGPLFVEGPKTNMIYTFSDYDDETELEYRDLVALVRSKDKAVYEPRFIIDDGDFLNEYPAVEKFYSDQFTTKDIRAILEMSDNEMRVAIKKLPKGAIDNLKTIAATQVAKGRLDSIKKIKTLNELLGIDLDLVGELLTD